MDIKRSMYESYLNNVILLKTENKSWKITYNDSLFVDQRSEFSEYIVNVEYVALDGWNKHTQN